MVDIPTAVDRPADRKLPRLVVTEPGRSAGGPPLPLPTPLPRPAEVYAALVLGTRDYLGKNGFTDAVIGLSGGIDSSLVAAVAVDALGPHRVHGISMPSRYSSEGSRLDAGAWPNAWASTCRWWPLRRPTWP